MKKPSEVFKNIRFAKLDPSHNKGHKGGSTDDEEHGAVSEIEWNQQLQHQKKRSMQEKVDKPTGELKDACWKGYTAVGMKMKDGKKVPNCVPTNESKDMKAMRIIKDIYKRKSVKEETDTVEKNEMVESQLHFIKYACDEILEYIEMGGEIEEWYQVKVAKSFSEFESLHAFMEGESRRLGMKEEVEQVEESFTMGEKVPNKQGGHNQDVHYNGKKIGRIESYSHRTGMKYGMEHHASGEGTAGSKSHEEALSDLKAAHKEHMKEEVEQVEEGMMKSMATDAEETKRLGSWRKETPWMKVKSTVTDKSGAKHTPMSRARDLARAAVKKNVKEETITESRLADIVREAAEKAKKKKKEETKKSDDTFQSEPELSSQIIRND
jgi:hypothetical protein